MGKINVAVVGVGNCASSLIQGVHKYREAEEGIDIPGIMHTVLGPYHIGDIDVAGIMGDDPLPNLCCQLPRSVRFQSSLPSMS